MRYVTQICEPERLVVTWQSNSVEQRARLKVAEVHRSLSGEVKFSYLKDTEEFDLACTNGFAGYPAFKLNIPIHRQNILPILIRRLPPKSRSDYSEYLSKFGLTTSIEISDFGVLGYTEAKLPSDSFNFIHPFDNAISDFEFVTEIAGFRYNYLEPVIESDLINRRVDIIPDGDNKFDQNAMQVVLHNKRIGYINKVQALAFRSWHDNSRIRAYINSIGGPEERREVQLFVSVKYN